MKEESSSSLPKNSRFANFYLTMTSIPLPLLAGFHFSVGNPITPTLQQMYNSTYERRHGDHIPNDTWTILLTLSASTLIAGAFIGGVITKSLLHYVTPKHVTQIAHLTNVVAIATICLGSGLTGSYEAFIVGRFLSGFPCGIGYVIAPMVVAETSCRLKQNFWQSAVGVAISLGLLLGVVFGHPHILGSAFLWPVALGMGVFPSLIYLLASFHLPETPFTLIRSKKKEEARKVLKKLRISEPEALKAELEEIESEINQTKVTFGILEILRNKHYRKQLIAVCALYANMMLSGIDNIVLYSVLVFTSAGLSTTTAGFASIGVFTLQFIAAGFGAKVVDRFGGKKVCIGANIIMITALSLFTVSQAAIHLSPNVMPLLSIVAVGLFMIGWSGGTNLATFALIGMLTIEPTRATSFSYGNAVLWLCCWIVGFMPPYLQIFLGAYSMVIWIACLLVFLIYMVVCLPETKRKSVSQCEVELHKVREEEVDCMFSDCQSSSETIPLPIGQKS